MRVRVTIRTTATETIAVEGATYEEARKQLQEQLPEGYELIVIRVDRD